MNANLVTPITQTIEVPCKNPGLSLLQWTSVAQPESDFLIRTDPIGKFYYPKNPANPMFQDCYFEGNPEYQGVFMTNAPLKIFFEITRSCNLKCKGCYIPNMSGDSMDFEKVCNVLDDAAASQVLSVQFLWGEPTLHKRFVDICRYAKSLWISVESVTNGLRITPDYAKRLEGIVSYMGVSIDGSEKTHNNFRGSPKSYERAVNAFRVLTAAGIHSEILMTVNRLNVREVEEVFEISGRDPGRFYLKVLHVADSMNEEMRSLCLDWEETRTLKSLADSLWIGIQAPVADFQMPGESSFFWCPGGILTGIIDVSGNVYKCLYLRKPEEVLGNVFSDSLRKIWENTKFRIEVIQSEKCGECSMKSSCGGFCTLCKERNRFL